MKCSQATSFHADQILCGEIAGTSSIEQTPCLHEWSGRFWLPAGERVDPTRKFCLKGRDGRLGEMTMGRFSLSDIEEDVIVFPVDRHFV